MKKRRRSEPLTLSSLTAPDGSEAYREPARAVGSARLPGADEPLSVAAYLSHAAAAAPDVRAFVSPAGRLAPILGGGGWATRTFGQLDAEASSAAAALVRRGLVAGERVAVALPPGPDLAMACVALWRAGAVPVIVERGLDVKAALAATLPTAFIGSSGEMARALVRRVLPTSVRRRFVVGAHALGSVLPGVETLSTPASGAPASAPIPATRGADPALVLFTSPPWGEPRPVVLDHRTVVARIEALRALLGPCGGQGLLATDAWGVLSGLALGATVITPASVGPASGARAVSRILDALDAQAITRAIGFPETWRRVAEACVARSRQLPNLASLALEGGPLIPQLAELLRAVLPQAAIVALHGSPEAFPIASISADEVLGETRALTDRGGGACLGRPAPGVALAILSAADGAGPSEVPTGEVGEIAVSGAIVATAPPVVPGGESAAGEPGPGTWHRTGTLGWLDRSGRVWSCGRKQDRVATAGGDVYPECVEGPVAIHSFARRVAVVNVGDARARRLVLVVEGPGMQAPGDGALRARLAQELAQLAARQELTRGLARVLFHDGPLPTDPLRASEIDRRALTAWARAQVGTTRVG